LATKIRTEGFLHPEKKVVMLGIAGIFILKIKSNQLLMLSLKLNTINSVLILLKLRF
jgi:hypothetical protein